MSGPQVVKNGAPSTGLDKELKIVPILWELIAGELHVPETNKAVHDACVAFMERDFGKALDLRSFYKVLTCLEVKRDAETGLDSIIQCVGMIALRWAIDCPVFHVSPTDDFRSARIHKDLLDRATRFLLDSGTVVGGLGGGMLVAIDPALRSSSALQRVLREFKAEESNRVVVEV